mgnify:CR=1 FL=1
MPQGRGEYNIAEKRMKHSRRLRAALILAVLTGISLPLSASADVVVRKSISYFQIGGRTAAELDAAVHDLAQRLASGPTLAYGHMRRLMRNAFNHDLPAQLAAEAEAFVACARSADLPEGIEAFHAKRPATFQGR